MNSKILWGVLVIAILVLVGAYFVNKNKVETANNDREQALQEVEQRPEITINAKHQFKDGVHTFLGTVELPTPCHTVTAEIVREGDQTIVDLKTEVPGEICAQVITERQFSLSFGGTADESIIARLDGELVNLNLFDIPADQDITEVDVFLKG